MKMMNETPEVTAPTRVIYSHEGDATTPERARSMYGVEPDVIFLRHDGWSLGAPSRLEGTAHMIWSEYWTHFARRGDTHFRPISEYYHS